MRLIARQGQRAVEPFIDDLEPRPRRLTRALTPTGMMVPAAAILSG
jgi:hypothetical protein